MDGFVPGLGQGGGQRGSRLAHLLHGRYAAILYKINAHAVLILIESVHNGGHLLRPCLHGRGVVAAQIVIQGIEGYQLGNLFAHVGQVVVDLCFQRAFTAVGAGIQTHFPHITGSGIGVVAGLPHQGVALDVCVDQPLKLRLLVGDGKEGEHDDEEQRQHAAGKSQDQAFFDLHIFKRHFFAILLIFHPRQTLPGHWISVAQICPSAMGLPARRDARADWRFAARVRPSLSGSSSSHLPSSWEPSCRSIRYGHIFRFSHPRPACRPPVSPPAAA